MRKRGIDLKLKTEITKIEKTGNSLQATLDDGSKLDAAQILHATGRDSKTPNLGLENAGVKLKAKGAVIVDDYSKLSVNHTYYLGDCSYQMSCTPDPIAEALALAH